MMSSSDGRRAAGKSAVAAEPHISTTAVTERRHKAGDGSEAASAEVGNLAPVSSDSGNSAPDRPDAGRLDAGDSEQDDPWFGAAQRSGLEPDADPEITRADWFMPGGRAALLPDSMTTLADGDETESGGSRQQLASAAAAGAPPWAADSTGSAAGAPPPWENGPWSGPGAAWPSPPAATAQGRPSQLARQDEPGPLTPRTVLVTGLLPLVVPGLVVGLLGLRRSGPGEPGRRASVLALAASLAWAVVIVVLVVATGGGSSSGGCSYPAGVHQAYAKAMGDLSGSASAATQATDLGIAASRANSAAAAAGDINVRTALFAMAGDLQEARADVIAKAGAGTGPRIPATLRAHLAADGAALTTSCRS